MVPAALTSHFGGNDMLTPQEVSDRAFQKASFGGYNMSQVDDFLDVLTEDYTSLYNENAVLKSKMKVLVDKVEEYRATEEAMRKALMTAQKMADDMIQEAEKKKASILQQVELDAAARTEELKRQMETEEYRLQQARQATAAYVEKVRAAQAEESSLLAGLQEMTPAPARTDPVEEKASEIDDNVQRLLAQAMRDAAAESQAEKSAPQPEEDEEELSSDTAEFDPAAAAAAAAKEKEGKAAEPRQSSRIDFGKLQFGADYEIK